MKSKFAKRENIENFIIESSFTKQPNIPDFFQKN